MEAKEFKGSGGKDRIKSPEVKAMFQQYFAWRKSLQKARSDSTLVEGALEMGEKLLAEFRLHQDHLEGVLTEDSFTRSIKQRLFLTAKLSLPTSFFI